MKNAALYIRVSTEEQLEYSPQVQMDELISYANNNQLEVLPQHIYMDEGISGRRAEKRPAFMKMIHAAKKHEFSVILVHKFDRFARNKEDSVIYKSMLKRDGIKVISMKEPLPEDDKFAVIYESMLEAMAEYYSLNLAEEVKKTMLKKAQMGEYQAIAPFGYKNENKTLVIVPSESSVVSYIFEQYLNYDKSFYSIAKELNIMGIRTHRGNPIDSRAIQYILRNPVYCGYVRWTPSGKIARNFDHPDSLIVKSSHPPIVSKDTFEQVQKKYHANKKKKAQHQRPMTDGKHWLSGLVKCSDCGRSLVISRHYNNHHFSMQCSGYNHGTCHFSHSVSSKIIVPSVLAALASLHLPNYVVQLENSQNNQLHFLQTSAVKLQQKLKKAKDAYLSNVDSLAEYQLLKEKLEAQLTAVVLQQQQLEASSAPVPPQLDSILLTLNSPSASLQEKQYAIRKIVDKIIFDKKQNCLDFVFLPP